MPQPLAGIRVLEWAVYQAGPEAGKTLASLGAEVVKIEDPRGGDKMRGIQRLLGNDVSGPRGMSLVFEALNMNVKSIALDLRDQRGREILYQLAEKSDVFLTNFRGPSVRQLGLTYENLKLRNPRIIYTCISGYGPNGPDADRPAMDFSVQARSGTMRAMKKPQDEPSYIVGLADQMGAITAVLGTVVALLARDRFGAGQEVQASLLGGMTWLQMNLLGAMLLGAPPRASIDWKTMVNPLHNIYPTAESGWISLCMGVGTERYWPEFCRAAGIEHLQNDPRFDTQQKREENNRELIAVLTDVFAKRPVGQWLERMKEFDLLADSVNTIPDLSTDPQLLENHYIEEFQHPVLGAVKVVGPPIHFSETPAKIGEIAPELGQHSEEILAEVLGYEWERIEQLQRSGIVGPV